MLTYDVVDYPILTAGVNPANAGFIGMKSKFIQIASSGGCENIQNSPNGRY
jgi:hypothetical protein